MKKTNLIVTLFFSVLVQTPLSYGMDTSIATMERELQALLALRNTVNFTPDHPEIFTKYKDFRCVPMWQTRAIKDDPDGDKPKSIFTFGANGCVILGLYSQMGKHQTAILSHNPPIPYPGCFKKLRKKTKLWLGKKNRHVIVLTPDVSKQPPVQGFILKTFVQQALKAIKIKPDSDNIHYHTYSRRGPEYKGDDFENDFEIVLDPNPLLSHCTDKDGRQIYFNQEV